MEGLQCLQRANAACPGDTKLLVKLGTLSSELGFQKDSVKHFKSALEMDPMNASIWYQLGMARWQSKKPSEALECFETALRVDPSLESAHIAAQS
ncbi:unnamed protein product, partial [Heterosigma akashiwo]